MVLGGSAAPFLLRRSRISLPVLKNGTLFFSTETCAPVRGLRPVRAGRNPRTGAHVPVDQKSVPFFKTGKEMRERLNRDDVTVESI